MTMMEEEDEALGERKTEEEEVEEPEEPKERDGGAKMESPEVTSPKLRRRRNAAKK